MKEEPRPRGAFAETVGWLVRATPHGTVSRLARESGVPERTLQKWLTGDHPRTRLTRNVELLDAWAMANATGYPPPEGGRLTTLVTNRGPDPVGTASRRRWPTTVTATAVVALGIAAITVVTAREVSGHGHRSGVVEYGDNHLGSPVFSSTFGAAAPAGVPSRIPYGSKVDVRCTAPNRSGIPSVTAFYLVSDGQWHDLWVVADTMTNGGPVGNTDTPNVDPAVPICSNGEH